MFAGVPEPRTRGYGPGRFSFNVKGGRCEACQGDGVIKVEMHFLPDIYVPCDVCHGKRYNRETLEVQYKGKNIHDILQMTVEQAREFFDAVPVVARKLQTLVDVGLSLHHARPERDHALRRRGAAREAGARTVQARHRPHPLHSRRTDHRPALPGYRAAAHVRCTAWPTTATPSVVIEHNLDVIKTADWLVDLGPEGGWDEERFGLECDLDHYMIVAVGDFNMGAMENKGLNIFNTKYVLARSDVAPTSISRTSTASSPTNISTTGPATASPAATGSSSR
jgi:excinuclease ABC subunit A